MLYPHVIDPKFGLGNGLRLLPACAGIDLGRHDQSDIAAMFTPHA